MSVLAINLAPGLISEFAAETTIRSARDIAHALSLIEAEDFHVVIEDARHAPGAKQDLAQLLAATPPGTIIYALVSNLWLPESEYWRSQGIKLVFDDPSTLLTHAVISG